MQDVCGKDTLDRLRQRNSQRKKNQNYIVKEVSEKCRCLDAFVCKDQVEDQQWKISALHPTPLLHWSTHSMYSSMQLLYLFKTLDTPPFL